MAKGGHETTNPPAVAFHNSLDDADLFFEEEFVERLH
jgi:hypothetical protein